MTTETKPLTREQLIARAEILEAEASVNDSYRSSMERTTERTNGQLGHLNNPSAYAAHGLASARRRSEAADLRAAATRA